VIAESNEICRRLRVGLVRVRACVNFGWSVERKGALGVIHAETANGQALQSPAILHPADPVLSSWPYSFMQVPHWPSQSLFRRP
jgi:hypothetical protein